MVGTSRSTGAEGSSAVRRLISVLALAACASPGAPPGGPDDDEAPKLLRITPDTNATNVKARRVNFMFDEVVNERPSGSGIQSLKDLVLISPRDGAPDVSWHRSRIEVAPRKGWRANTAYTITMLPGLADLRGNRDTVGHTLVFSTGPTIPTSKITGYIFDWLQGRITPDAYIEAITPSDTNFRYVAATDTSGRFTIAHVPPGQYRLRAIVDANHNRALDAREASDTATITLRDSVVREMLTYVHDTIGPGIATVSVRDSLTLRISFDRAIDTAQKVTPALFSVKAADSARVGIASAQKAAEVEQAEKDSAAKAARADSVKRAAAADSARRADSLKAVASGQRPAPRVPERPTAVVPTRPDTAKPPPAPRKPSIPSPTTDVVLRLDAPLKPATSYRVRAENVRSLVGRTRSSDRVITTDKRVPVDSTKAKRDTAATKSDSTRKRPP
jgi:hypothetical protein